MRSKFVQNIHTMPFNLIMTNIKMKSKNFMPFQ